jgi:hypothetical protein
VQTVDGRVARWFARITPAELGLERLLPLAPLLLLLGVCELAELIRQAAQLSDPVLDAFAAPTRFDSWKDSLGAASHDYVARLGWATAIAVYLPVWIAAVVACMATLKRESARWALWGLFPSLWLVIEATCHSEWVIKKLHSGGAAAALLGLIVLGAAVFGRSSGVRRRTWWAAGIFLVAFGAGVWVMNGWPLPGWFGLAAESSVPSRQVALVAPPFDALLLRLGDVCSVAGMAPCAHGIYGLDRLVGGLSVLALALLALAGTVLMADILRRPSDPPTPSNTLSAWGRQQREFRLLLYLGAALLVISVTVAKSLQQWPLSVVHDPAVAKQLQLIADQWLMMLGTYWTLMLAAIFLPLALALTRRANEMADAPGASAPGANAGGILEKQPFKFSILEQCTTVIALLGPWLAGGPLAGFASWLKTPIS